MKKILLISGHSRTAFKWGLVGEVTKRLLDNPEYEVYYLDCNNIIKTPCGTNDKIHYGYCNKCSKVCLNILEYIGFPDNNILKIHKVDRPNFPNFKSIKELIDYNYDGYNYGLSPASVIMTITRDYSFDIKKWNKKIKDFLYTEHILFKNIEELDNKYHFDEIHTFNGRMMSMYPAVSYAKKKNIQYVVYERGSNINSLRIIPNNVPHNFDYLKSDVNTHWNNDTPIEEKIQLANKWFIDRRAGKYQAIESFTKDQINNYLPKNWDENKENIVFFNSSIDEVYAFESWKHPFADNENDIIRQMLEHYKDDTTKHFYLRVHPNLTRAKKKKATQIREINQFKKDYKNILTVIEPDEKIDTYALIDAADKVVTAYSTVGCEATYWGAVSIVAGKAPYEDSGCIYKANSMEELYNYIDDKNLQPKPKETSYPYAYFNQCYGIPNKYWQAISHNEGYFIGLHLLDK